MDLPKHKEFLERQKKLKEIKNKIATPKPIPKKRKIQHKTDKTKNNIRKNRK